MSALLRNRRGSRSGSGGDHWDLLRRGEEAMKASPIPKWIMPALFCLVLSLRVTSVRPRRRAGRSGPARRGPDAGAHALPRTGDQDSDRGASPQRRAGPRHRGGVPFRLSPASRANTGPLSRFVAMLKEGPYQVTSVRQIHRESARGSGQSFPCSGRRRSSEDPHRSGAAVRGPRQAAAWVAAFGGKLPHMDMNHIWTNSLRPAAIHILRFHLPATRYISCPTTGMDECRCRWNR